MVKCNPSKIYMDLLGEMKGKNVQINNYDKLTKIEKQILDIILENPEITQVTIASMLEMTPKTVQRGISKLKENKIIERVGSSKKGYWKTRNK